MSNETPATTTPNGISPEALAALLADIKQTGDEIAASIDKMVISDEERKAIAETAVTDPVAAHALLDGHMADGIAIAEAAKKKVMDQITKGIALVSTLAATGAGGAFGGPAGAAAAGGLASAIGGAATEG